MANRSTCEFILFCRSSDVIPDVVSKTGDELIGEEDGECVEEDVVDVGLLEVQFPLLEVASLLGRGTGSDCFNGIDASSNETIHEESSSGRGTILKLRGS